jgi:polyisoprenoid-binding protein YceI
VVVRLSLYIICILFSYSVSAQQVSDALIPNTCFLNYISIEGETNVNSFYFTYQNNTSGNTYSLSQTACNNDTDTGIINFKIPVNAFNGSNPAMFTDFQTLLKASEFPKVIVGVQKKILRKIATGSGYSDKLNLFLTMAGVTRPIEAKYTTRYLPDGNILLSGVTHIKLTDFSLDPPKKMLGIIRVEDSVFIKFELVLPTHKPVINRS